MEACAGAPPARLSYGAFPRLVMLWMYAECVRTAQDPPQHHDPVFFIEIESTEAQALLDQAHRLFACRFTTR